MVNMTTQKGYGMQWNGDKNRTSSSFDRVLALRFIVILVVFTGFMQLSQAARATVGGEVLWSSVDAQLGKQEAAASTLDASGNLLVTGTSTSMSGNEDWYTIKMAADGAVLWQRQFDFGRDGFEPDEISENDRAVAVAVDGSGNVIVAGYGSVNTNVDIIVMKYDSSGNILWGPYAYNGSGNGYDYASALAIDSDDNIYVAGYSESTVNTDDGVLIKLEPNGSLVRVIEYDDGASDDDRFVGLVTGNDTPGIINDDYVVVTGYSWHDHGGRTDFDYLTIKYNDGGFEQWTATYDGGDNDDRGQFVQVDANHDVVVTGYQTIGTRKDIHTIKYAGYGDGSGGAKVLWAQTHSDTEVYSQNIPESLVLDSAGDVYIAGAIFTDSGMDDFYVTRRQGSDGSQLWKKNYDSGGQEKKDIPAGLAIDGHGGVYVAGYVQDGVSAKIDFLTTKFHQDSGDLIWADIHPSRAGQLDASGVAVGVSVMPDGHISVAGWSGVQTDYASGTATSTSADSSTVVDGAQLPWAVDQWQSYYVMMLSGPDVGENLRIISNTDHVLTVQSPFSSPVQGGDAYVINNPNDYDYYVVKYDYGMLNPPTMVNATVVSESQVEVSWTDRSTTVDEDDFCVERCSGIGCGGADFVEIGCVAGTALPFVDAGLTPHVRYTYRVRSRKLSDYSGYSEPVEVLTTLFNPVAPGWLYTYDGDDSLADSAKAIAVGPDNHPVVTGTSISVLDQYDYYTAKINRDTAVAEWTHRYNDIDGETDIATCVAVTESNEVVVSGYSSLDSGGATNTNDIFTLRFAASGPDIYNLNPPTYGTLWTDQFNGPDGGDDRSEAVDTTSTSNATVVVGYGRNAVFNDDIYVVYYDAVGTRIWSDIYDGGSGDDYPRAVAFDSSGNVIVVGTTFNGVDDDHFLRKYAPDGTILWTNIYDSGYGADELNAVTTDPSGNIYAVGFITNEAAQLDMFVRKYNSLGSYQWTELVGGNGVGYDEAIAVAYDQNRDEVVVGGMYTSDTGSIDFQVRRHSASSGAKVWARTLDRAVADDFLVAMAMDLDGNTCVAGDTDNGINTDILSVCYDAVGNLLGSTLYDGPGAGDDSTSAMTVNSLGEMFVAGSGVNAAGNLDYVVFKSDTNTLLAPASLNAVPRYTTVDLSWVDNAVGEDSYKIWRMDNDCASGGNFSFLYSSAPDAEGFTDSGLSEDSSYCYRVQTFKGGITSVPVEIDAKTLIPPAPGCSAVAVSTTELALSWTDSTDGEEGIEILRCLGTDCLITHPDDVIASPALGTEAYSDTSVCQDGQYTYRVRLYNDTENWQATSDCVNVAPASVAVLNSVSAAAVSEGEVVVSWLDSNADSEGYTIYKCEGVGCTPTAPAIATASVDSFSPVVDLKMNDGSWVDSSGNGNNVIAWNGASVISPGRMGGGAGDFDGIDDQADWSYNSGWPTNNFSMAAWFKIDAGVTHEIDSTSISGTGGTSGQNYLFGAQLRTDPEAGSGVSVGVNGISVYEHSGGYMPALAVYSGTISSGWNHLVVTYTNKQPRIYLNGNLVKAGYASPKTTVYAPYQLGGGAYGNFPGQIDDVKIFDYTLSDVEVATLAQTGYHVDTNVLPGRSYTYRVTASKTATCAWESGPADSTVVPALADPCPVSALPAGTTTVDLSWTDNFSFESAYEIERCEGAGCLSSCTEGAGCNVGTVSANTTTFSDSNAVCPGGSYDYQVRAYKGTVAPYEWSTVCTASVTTPTPIDPTNLSAARYSEQEIIVTWDDTNSDETGFSVERCEVGVDCPAFGVVGTAPAATGQGSYIDQGPGGGGLAVGHTYRYRVKAEKSGASCGWPTGYSNESNDATPTIIGPSALKVSSLNSTDVSLSWTNGTSWESGFSIGRCEVGSDCPTFTEIDSSVSSGESTYIDTSACSGTTYQYQVTAVNLSWPVNPATGPSAAVTTSTNQAPFNATVTAVSESEVGMSWLDSNPDESGFTIERCDDTAVNCISGPFTVVGSTGPTSLVISAIPTDYSLHLQMDESAWVANTYDIVDATGSGNNGRSYGAFTAVSDVSGRAGNFDGYNDYVMMQNYITLSRFGSTLSWWMKPDSATVNTGLFTNQTYNATISMIESRSSSIYGETNNNCNYITFNGVAKNTDWTMYTIVFDNERSYLYVNGEFFGETPDYGLDNCSATPATKLLADLTLRYIGQRTNYSPQYYDGQMDEVAVYNRALSAEEIGARFDSLATKFLLNFEGGNWNGTAGEVFDSSGSGHNGTAHGDVATATVGTHQNAAFFDGVGDYIDLGDIDELDAPSALSVALWFNRSADQSAATGHGINNVLLSQSSDVTNDNLEIGSQGSAIEVYFDTSSGADPVKSVEAGIQNDTWYHLVLTYDKNVTNPLKMYLNGALLAEWSEFSGPLASSTSSPLTLGIARPGGSQFPGGDYHGYLDEMSSYGYALSAAEIAAMYKGEFQDGGVLPLTAYTYRVKAQKSSSCSWPAQYSQPVEVIMPSPPPPSNLVATPVSTTQIDLSWTDNTGSESGYRVLRCLDTGGGCIPVEITVLAADTESYSDTGLCEPGTYSYRVAAIVSGVDVENQPSAVAAAPLLPSAPTGMSVLTPTETEATLSWTDNMTEESGYKVDRCLGAGCVPISTDNIGEQNHQFQDTFAGGIDPSFWNQYGETATASAGIPPVNLSDGSGTVSISALGGAVELITTSTGGGADSTWNYVRMNPVTPSALGSGDFDVQVDYSLPDGEIPLSLNQTNIYLRLQVNIGADFYYVDRGHNGSGGYYLGQTRINDVYETSPAMITTDTSGKLRIARVGSTVYCYVWTGGDWLEIESSTVTPGGIPTWVQLSQHAERNENANLRTIIDDFAYTAGSGGAYSYYDQGLTPDSAYVYKVYPYKGTCLWEDYSQTVAATPQVSCPTDLHSTYYNTTEMGLGWSDTTSSESAFEIERCAGVCDGSGVFSKIAETGAGQNSYADLTTLHSSSYSYRVKAVNSTLGWSCYSNILTNNTLAPVVPTNFTAMRGSEVRVELSWDDTNVDESQYVIERGDGSCAGMTELAVVGPDIKVFSDTSVLHSNTYCYQVKACKDDLDPGAADNHWCTSFGNQATATTNIVAPDPLTASPSNTTRVDLSWSDSAESETGFVLERCQGSGCNTFAEIAASPAGASSTALSDNEVCPGGTYRYQVKAEKLADWSSPFSSPVEVVTPAPQKVELFTAAEMVDEFDVRQVTVSWSDVNLDEDNFSLERCEGGGCSSYVPLATVNSLEDIKAGVDPAFWGQWGGLETVSSASVPIDISDSSGVAAISEVDNGVEFVLTSTGGGSSWNNASLFMVNPEDLGAGDFDMQVDFDLPDGEVSSTVNQFYLRLVVYFPDPDGSDPLKGDYFYIQRMSAAAGGKYKAVMQVNNIIDSGAMLTTDTIGKLRITRSNDVLSAYAWTGGSWQQIGPSSAAVKVDLPPSKVEFGPIAATSEAVSLRTVVSDFKASNIYTDDTVVASTTYCYRISPTKAAACSWDPALDRDNLYSEVCTVTAPASPANFIATVDGMAITLDWQDNSSDEDGFEILKMLSNGKFVTIDTVGPDTQTYTDSRAINPDTLYTYRIRAVRGVDRSGFAQVTTTDPTFWQAPVCTP